MNQRHFHWLVASQPAKGKAQTPKHLFQIIVQCIPPLFVLLSLVVSGVITTEGNVLLEPILLDSNGLASNNGGTLALNLDGLGLVGSELLSNASIGRLGKSWRGGNRPLLDSLRGLRGGLGLGLVVAQFTKVDVLDWVRGRGCFGNTSEPYILLPSIVMWSTPERTAVGAMKVRAIAGCRKAARVSTERWRFGGAHVSRDSKRWVGFLVNVRERNPYRRSQRLGQHCD
jgi:hypothetical protein